MKLLGWDTSSKVGSIVALEWDEHAKAGWEQVKLVSEWTLNVDATHSDHLLWGIHQVLSASRWALADVDVFAVGQGPGSFTGLRIGITTARTLAHAMHKPLIGISSLAALARPVAMSYSNLQKKSSSPLVIAATDACKGELFALYGSASSVMSCVVMAEGDQPGLWKKGVEEKVLTPDDLLAALRKKLGTGMKANWIVVGEGRTRYREMWEELPVAKRLESHSLFSDHVQGRYLGLLAWEACQADITRDALQVHPRYLRASDAEVKLKAGLLKAGPTRGLSE